MMEQGSPPRKKLKQARLPFQVISPKKKEKELPVDGVARKRPLISDTLDEDTSASKLFKCSDDSKENNTLENPTNVICVKTKSPEVVILEDVPVDAEEKNLCSTQTQGCEDVDSAEEAVETEPSALPKQHVSSANLSISSKDLISCSKSSDFPLSKGHSDAKSLELEHNDEGPENIDIVTAKSDDRDNGILSVGRSLQNESIETIRDAPPRHPSAPNHETKLGPNQMVGTLSQKTYDMFSKWRKVSDGIEIDQDIKKASPEKAVEAVEEVVERSLVKEECHSTLVKNVASALCSSSDRDATCKDVRLSEIVVVETDVDQSEDDVNDSAITVFDLADNCLSPQSSANNSKAPHTPKVLNKTPQRRLTPKQIEKEKEKKKKQEEKEKLKLERQMEKKRLKDEKEEQKKKEKEEKEGQKKKEREEKEKKRQAEIDLKNEEKKRKEEQKAEEKKKREEEKKKAEEEEERKKAKASAMFTSFFVPKPTKTEKEDLPQSMPTVRNFMPFEVKADMRIAPLVRVDFHSSQKKHLDGILSSESCTSDLYLKNLETGKACPKSSLKTWPLEESKDEDDDVCIVEQEEAGVFIAPQKKIERIRAKYLQFHENHRPAYWGTWRKQSTSVTGRRPFGHDEILDYEVDSADEWEEEEPGESLHGSDDDKEQESEDEYEVDNSVFVPHGYLSDDEGDADEANNQVLSPETQKAKLKLLGEEFEAQMKSGTSSLKPIIIFLTAAMQANACKLGSLRYQKLLDRRAVWREDDGPIVISQLLDNESSEMLQTRNTDTSLTGSSGPGAKKKLISEEALPALITLIHGNQNKRPFLVKEFSYFLQHCVGEKDEKTFSEENGCVPEITEIQKDPITPRKSCGNALVNKWPSLPPASKISISDKIREIAVWKPCPDEGPLHNRYCWYVPKETREHYGLLDLKLPNTWVYSLKPKVTSQTGSPCNTSVSNVVETKAALITKFTKVMTPEEKQRQWDSMKNTGNTTPSGTKNSSSKSSAGKITAFTSQIKPQEGATSSPFSGLSVTKSQQSSSSAQTKKRVPLLVSVPRGQQISSVAHCSLLEKFEASATTSSNIKHNDKSKQSNVDCILLD